MARIEFYVFRKFNCLDALLRNKKLRDNLELPEEDHILVAMESEYSSPGPWSKMGLNSRHQISTKVHLYVMAEDFDRHWEPDTAFRGAIGALFRLDKGGFSVDHVPGLITAIRAVGSVKEAYKDQKYFLS